jgi:SAM-dependent methyltransferase
MKFEKKYTEYWKNNIINPIDGLKIADVNEVLHFLPFLHLCKADNVLDLGCSFGRMHKVLNEFSENIFGIDPDIFAVENSIKVGYTEVKVGNAENITFPDEHFHKIFCWAVYDVVDHWKGLLEANRVLKKNGKMLITGKNDNYYENDKNAFDAEKNAFLKSFPNHFVDINLLLKNIKELGFRLEHLFLFPRRGDLGKLIFTEVDEHNGLFKGYEYLMILEKVESVKNVIYFQIDTPHSKTANSIAQKNGYPVVAEYFKKLGID